MTPATLDDRFPFSVWIRQQTGRDDMVGDLARDFVSGIDMQLHDGNFETPKQFKRQVLDVVGGDVWKPAYRQAKAEFKATQKAG